MRPVQSHLAKENNLRGKPLSGIALSASTPARQLTSTQLSSRDRAAAQPRNPVTAQPCNHAAAQQHSAGTPTWRRADAPEHQSTDRSTCLWCASGALDKHVRTHAQVLTRSCRSCVAPAARLTCSSAPLIDCLPAQAFHAPSHTCAQTFARTRARTVTYFKSTKTLSVG